MTTLIARLKMWFIDHRREVVLFIYFFLVSTISFALGYLSAGENQHAPIIIQKNN